MNYKYLLFDADDTLFDYTKAEGYALSKAFEHYGIPLRDDIFQAYRTINQKLWDQFEQGTIDLISLRSERFRLLTLECGIKIAADYLELSKTYLNYLAEGRFLIEGALEVCQVISSQGIYMAIITNGIREVQHERIRGSELSSYFDTIIVSEDAGYSKPHTGIFEYTFNKLGGPKKHEVLIIGDSLTSDIQGGHTYGIDTCWYNPKGKSNTTGVHPTYEITSLDQLVPIICGDT